MIGLKVMLFGIALICFGGFFVVAQTVGYVSGGLYSVGMFVGLLLSFLGLLVDDEQGRGDDQQTVAERFDSNDGDENGDDEKESNDADRADHSANYFPPM
ncbi:hypothetical protein [Halorussus pelagicus]|uniref:hypothetical protein n=1 Tax=Halorussus pelagicus TaxID=2505977 RepID=UPI000FFC71FB|nr:hypothetical protein [Halorussus pelagicus]